MAPAEVVITGVGMVTPLGGDAPSTVAAWRGGAGASKWSVAELAGTPYEGAQTAALRIPAVDGRIRNKRLLKYTSGAGVLGCLAAAEASQDADIASRFPAERVGLYAGAGMSSANLGEALPMITKSLDEDGRFSASLLGANGLTATNPLTAFKILPNMAPCLVSMIENIKGQNLIFTPWEGQTAAALVEAWQAVASGEVDCALAGGADDASNPATLAFLCESGKLGAQEFAAAAAGYMVFERLDSARKHKRLIHARIRGMTLRCAGNSTMPTSAKSGQMWGTRGIIDPLANRIGRTYAAAPALLLALACFDRTLPVALTGVDRQEFRAELETEA